jgi:hypothetical protein
MGQELGREVPQMPLAEHHKVVEQLLPQGLSESLGVRVPVSGPRADALHCAHASAASTASVLSFSGRREVSTLAGARSSRALRSAGVPAYASGQG